jgi:hypothetical protein
MSFALSSPLTRFDDKHRVVVRIASGLQGLEAGGADLEHGSGHPLPEPAPSRRRLATRRAVGRLWRPRRPAALAVALLPMPRAPLRRLREPPLPVLRVIEATPLSVTLPTEARAATRLRPVPREGLEGKLALTPNALAAEAASRP